MQRQPIPESVALESIRDFLNVGGDLDDIAQIYSRYLQNGVVILNNGRCLSDPYRNGRRVRRRKPPDFPEYVI